MATDPKMENEVKLTVIATGFPTADNMQDKEEELKKLLAGALTDGDTDVDLPPFLRRVSKYAVGAE